MLWAVQLVVGFSSLEAAMHVKLGRTAGSAMLIGVTSCDWRMAEGGPGSGSASHILGCSPGGGAQQQQLQIVVSEYLVVVTTVSTVNNVSCLVCLTCSGVYNDLGSGSNVDLCVITKDSVDYLRNYEFLMGKTYNRQFPVKYPPGTAREFRIQAWQPPTGSRILSCPSSS
jgi:hypothetical protein